MHHENKRRVYVLTTGWSLIRGDPKAVPLGDVDRALMAVEMNLLTPGMKAMANQDWWVEDLEVTNSVNVLLKLEVVKMIVQLPKVRFNIDWEKWDTFKREKIIDAPWW